MAHEKLKKRATSRTDALVSRPWRESVSQDPKPSPPSSRDPQGDQEAVHELSLEALYRQHARYVAGVAARLLGRDDEVDDVVQDVFVQAMKDLHQLRDSGAVRSWLARIAVRTARRRLRKRRVYRLMFLDEYDYARVAAPGVSPERATELSALYRALDELAIDDRLAWSLRCVEGHSLKEVSDLCGCSLATTKRRIGRATEQLRKKLDA